MKPKIPFSDLWPKRRMYAKPAYVNDADREYAARVRKNKSQKSARRCQEQYKAEAAAMRQRNAPIIEANERMMRAKQEREIKRLQRQREIDEREELRQRLKDARNKASTRTQIRALQQRVATPRWANKGAIMSVYAKAARMQKTTGIKHHVDHIVPITNRLVCGLHCEANLQVLTKRENVMKLNRWWPDMPADLADA